MARWQFRPPVETYRDGFRINLDRDERDLVVRLMRELRGLLLGPSDNPLLVRLFPTAYHLPEHAAHDEEYQRLMREEIVASRLSGIDTVEAALTEPPPLSEGEMMALVQAVNGIRLVMAAALDVDEDHDPADIDDDHPQAADYHLYSFLSWLLEWSVRALAAP
jgi:hypothetical protein